MKHWLIAGFILLTSPLLHAGQIHLGPATQYNGFFFGDFSASKSNTEGALAVGGNAHFADYSVNLAGKDKASVPGLVVAGTLNFGVGDVYGETYVGKTASVLDTSSLHNGLFNQAALPVDFAKARQHLSDLSSSLSSLQNPLSVDKSQAKKLVLIGDNSEEDQVFNIDARELDGVEAFLYRNINEQAYVVINIAGEKIDFNLHSDTDMAAHHNGQRTLLNFYQARDLRLHGTVWGTILAPDAHVSGTSSRIEGQVIAQSWRGPMQLSHNPFDESEASVFEPSSLLLLLLVSPLLLMRRER